MSVEVELFRLLILVAEATEAALLSAMAGMGSIAIAPGVPIRGLPPDLW